MIRHYLLIGVVSVAGLLIVAAIITANTNLGDRQSITALSEAKTNIRTPVVQNESAAIPNADKAVFDVQGMSCSGCIYTIKSGLAEMDGISDVLVDVGSGRVEVFYDSPGQGSAEDRLGYHRGWLSGDFKEDHNQK